MRRGIVFALALAGCSSFELDLNVLRLPAPDAEVRIDGAVVGDVYHASFDDYDAAKRARPHIEVLRQGVVTDTWDDVILACDWVCSQDLGDCPAPIVSASLDVVVQADYTISKAYEGKCAFDNGETIGFIP